MQIKNKTFLITGASEGLGKEIALKLAEQQARLILAARNQNNLEEVKRLALEKGAISATIIPLDLTDFTSIKEVAKSITEIDGLVNNAGIWQLKAQLDKISETELMNVLNTNLTGLILLTKSLLPRLREAKEACIINISSRSGYMAQAGQSIYSATKFGLRGFTQVLREDLADTNIRVAGLYQGGTNTQMFNKAGEGFPQEKLNTFIPAAELAETVKFLISRPSGIWISEIRVENK